MLVACMMEEIEVMIVEGKAGIDALSVVELKDELLL